ncbi:MAG: GtrA family protein [Bacteroidales bacterium]|nr:GtrA family protein [Bacteroidales bacterium]HNW72224.1 GtrA family protein [Bacteroidales bacterium]HPS49303.1 GtrA family protein [Bacteroidales bacterium]
MDSFFTEVFILKFIKFCIVGFSGVFVDFGITFICKEYLKIQKYIANSCGFVMAASSNYLMNRIWTFHSSNPNIALEFTRFFIIALIGLLINLLIIWALTGKFRVNFYLSKLVATIVVTLWNFLINAYYTFA